MLESWKTLARKAVLEQAPWLAVEMHTIQLPDGKVIHDWPWLITQDFVLIVAITSEAHYLCFRQTKYSVKGTTLATPGGYVDPGEEPLTAAKRELLEETG